MPAASSAYVFNGSNPGSTPPYTTGATEPGQCTFAQPGAGGAVYPYLYVDGLAQNYWVDIEPTPLPTGGPRVHGLHVGHVRQPGTSGSIPS